MPVSRVQASQRSCLCPPSSTLVLLFPSQVPLLLYSFSFSNLKYTTFSLATVPFHLLSPSVWNVLFLIPVLASFPSRFKSQLKHHLLQETFCAYSLVRLLHSADLVTLLLILFLLLNYIQRGSHVLTPSPSLQSKEASLGQGMDSLIDSIYYVHLAKRHIVNSE